MTTFEGVITTVLLLAAVGLAPTFFLVGQRWTVIPLSILTGAVVSAIAATCFVAFGATLMTWFGLIAGVLAVASLAAILHQHRHARVGLLEKPTTRRNALRALAAVVLVVAAVFCLRGLHTPLVGLDTRLFWFLRSAWWLRPHSQAIANMRYFGFDIHAGYPPLVSSVVAVAWALSGTHSYLVGLYLIAILNICAGMVAAWAVVEYGFRLSNQLRLGSAQSSGATRSNSFATRIPIWSSIGAAVLLTLIYFGVTEPFTTNGYADPLWAVSAVGALVYAFQLPTAKSWLGSAVILLAVAGETKSEGTATAIAIIVLVVLRIIIRNRRLSPRLAIGAVSGILALVAWPILMRIENTGADINTTGPRESPLWMRTTTTYDALAPHLHVVPIAIGLTIVSGLCFAPTIRNLSMESTLWMWSGLALGMIIIASAYVVGPGTIRYLEEWLETSAHRVTEFLALGAWWIIALVVVSTTAVPAALGRRRERDPSDEHLRTEPAGQAGETSSTTRPRTPS